MNTQQKKLIGASQNFGNTNIKKQQGRTREIFDYIKFEFPYTTPTTFNFFKYVSQKDFPFTNINSNMLEAGESFIIQRIWFTVAIVSRGGGLGVGNLFIVQPLGDFASFVGMSQYSWFNDNLQVLKNKSLLSHFPQWCATAQHERSYVKNLETLITLQPFVPFTCTLKVPLIPVVIPRDVEVHLGCHIEGTGTLFAPKHNY